jgi:DNA-binding NarL/FixJ family response regulator
MDGLVATRLIKEENSSVAIIMLTSFQSSDYLSEAVEAGAAGYLLKGMERAKLLSAIGDVVAGYTLFDPIELVSILREMKKAPDPLDAVVESLTEREEEVLSLVSAGKTNGAIAEDLSFSISTVKKTVQDIISKFGVSDRTQAAVMAARQGWNPKDRTEQS